MGPSCQITVQRRESEAHSVVSDLVEVKYKHCDIVAYPGHRQREITEEMV